MDDAAPGQAAADQQAQAARVALRRGRLMLLAAAVVIGVALWGVYYLVVARHHVKTDNAYVGAEVAQVTPLVAGPVAKVLVAETDAVKTGQPLVLLDDSDARLAVAAARAALGQAERRVHGYYASDAALAGRVSAKGADISQADAGIAAAAAEFDRARTDLSRRKALAPAGAVSGEELTAAISRYASANAALASARAARAQALADRAEASGERAANAANITGVIPNQNPDVALARARLEAAELALSRTIIRAPKDGIVTKRTVVIGQQVAVGAPIMAIVPTVFAFVDANYKEVQLRKVRPGQKVVLTSDLYGGGVKFHGVVRGLSGGTGAAFSLIPPQNATGNWIKVVQRLPVRIYLDPVELKEHPLRVGLSMKADIDTASN